MLTQSNVPRVNNVNFAVRVGTVVPQNVRLVRVHPVLIEIRPEFRDHEFFVVDEDIVIVDRSRRIVAVVDARTSGAQLGTGGGGGSARGQAVSFDDLSVEEIRQIQLVLIREGFDIGVADGKLGAKTRQALISFQQRRGLQATGRIDSQTVTALGVNIRGMGASTTGQGGNNAQSPANQNNQNNQNMGGQQGQQPGGTTGQGSGQPNQNQQPPANQNQQPSANQNQQPPANQNMGGQQGGGNQPSTTGQGGNNQGSGNMQPPPNNQGGNVPANQAPPRNNNQDGAAR